MDDVGGIGSGREYGSFVDVVKDLPNYLTTWSVLFIVAHKYVHSIVDLQLLSLIVMFGGFMISYSGEHGSRHIQVGDIHIPPWLMVIDDMVFHVFPFLFVQYHYGDYYRNVPFCRAVAQIGVVLGIVAVYMVFVDPMEQYFISREIYRTILRGVMEIVLIYLLVTQLYHAMKKGDRGPPRSGG